MRLVRPLKFSMLTLLLPLLAGCDMLGLPNPAKEAAQVEAEGKAVGAACRHSGRSLEDCYALYPDQSRALVFAGWKEMQDYMAAGNLTAVPPTIERDPPKPAADASEEDEEDAPRSAKSSRKRSHTEDEEHPKSGKSGKGDGEEKHVKADAH